MKRNFTYKTWTTLFREQSDSFVILESMFGGRKAFIPLEELYQHFKERMEYEQMIEKGETG